jgi:DNA topoisomerase VI subunit A
LGEKILENFPGTEEAWYLSLKEKILRLIEQLKEDTLELTDRIKNISPKKILYILNFILEILRVKRKAVIEDIIFSPKAIGESKITDKDELEKVLQYIELIIQAPREDFRLFEDIPCPVYGNLEVEYYSPLLKAETNFIKLNDGNNIKFIDPLMYRLIFMNCKADKVVATSLDLEDLIEKGVGEKLNSILVGLGYPVPRSTRNILRRLSIELNLPIYVLTESTPEGLYSTLNLIKGPMDPLPQYLQKFSVPHALWVGVSIMDITDNLRVKTLNGFDRKLIEEMKKNPMSKSYPYNQEIKQFENRNIKVSIDQIEKMDVVAYLSSKIP